MHSSPTDSLSAAHSHLKKKAWAEAAELYGGTWTFLDERDQRKHIADYAKALRKLDMAEEGLALFEPLYGGPPKSNWEKNEYCWCLYKSSVKVWDEPTDVDSAAVIVNLCSPSDKYSPHGHTVIHVASYFLNERHDAKSAIEWLNKTSASHLDDEAYYHAENKSWHPSLRFKYFRLLASALTSQGDLTGTIRCCLDTLDFCFLEPRSTTIPFFDAPVWTVYKRLIQVSSKAEAQSGASHIVSLLEKVGFRDRGIRSRYLQALLAESSGLEDWGPLWDHYKDDASWSGKQIPDYSAVRRVAEAVRSLEGERRLREESYVKRRPKPRNRVTATELADFVFCPASLAIKQTFWTGSTDSMEAGTRMHEERLLDAPKPFKGLGGWEGAAKDPLAYLRGHLPSESIVENRAALLDIATSRPFFSGHGKGKPKPFRNDDLDFEGIPDYVFERRDGKRFIVEEKFRAGSGIQQNDKPFTSHLAQLSSYIHYLHDLEADYGYLVYWYQTAQHLRVKTKQNPNPKTLSGCSIYRIRTSEKALTRLNEIMEAVRFAKSGEPAPFDPSALHASKCVKCSVVQFCNHKTGRFGEASIPYSLATGLGS